MDTKNDVYVNLLLVEIDGTPYVVESAYTGLGEGCIVEFDNKLARCVNEMFVEKGGDKYSFVAALHSIYQAEKIYGLSWEA